MNEARAEKLKRVIRAIKTHQETHGPPTFGEDIVSRAQIELKLNPNQMRGKPLSMREVELRQALVSLQIVEHPKFAPYHAGDPFHGLDSWPLVVGAEARLYHPNGKSIKGTGAVTITGLERPEKYPYGIVHYRVLEHSAKGSWPAGQVMLVKKTDRTRRDSVGVLGMMPSNRGYKKPKKG